MREISNSNMDYAIKHNRQGRNNHNERTEEGCLGFAITIYLGINMNKKTVNYMILAILSILMIIGDVVCLCGLWYNHPGSKLTLATGALILISSLIQYFRAKGKNNDQKNGGNKL